MSSCFTCGQFLWAGLCNLTAVRVCVCVCLRRDDYVDYITKSSRWTALLMAVHLNHSKTVQKLLDHGAGQ